MTGPWQRLTGRDNYFEDFPLGRRLRHARGKTVTEMDNVLITNLVMNTAQSHFNEDSQQATPSGRRIVFGGVTIALVVGLATQDTGENALAELGLDQLSLPTPVFHGDTLYAESEVLDARVAERGDAGIVRFRHRGRNQTGAVVMEGIRTVLVKRRPGG
ncbi:MAG: MaoC family dehydratase [Alphaproteobacteria bacterium]|nr:MaoC family dehydratase [Alphaproteobacteria bacterium]